MSMFLIQQSDAELESVRNFQTRARLTGVRMKDFCARSAEKEPVISNGLELDLKHSVPRTEAADGLARFDVKLEIEALGDKDPEKMLFHVDCCIELTYTLAPDYSPTPSDLDAFKRGNAVFHSWPYMREFVQSATQRMGLSVPPIPLLRLAPLPQPGVSPRRVVQRKARPARKRATKREAS